VTRREHGQALVEYAMLLGLAVVVATVALGILGSAVSQKIDSMVQAVNTGVTIGALAPAPTSGPNITPAPSATPVCHGNGHC
jgi:Flp pilus assembly pilin Flp